MRDLPQYDVYNMRALAVLLVAAGFLAGDELPQHVLQLARLKARMKQSLATLPDYTCVIMTERYERVKAKAPRHVDTIRLEVAHAAGQDLYAWPGESRFEYANPSELINNGLFSTGEFSSHAYSLFVNALGVMKYHGADALAGRNALRWDYVISQFVSGWKIALGSSSAVAGSAGSFWVDPETLDVLRIEARSQDLPPGFPVEEVTSAIDYSRVRIGSRDVLLPQTAVTTLTEASGTQKMNVIEFSHCRQFSAKSDVTFDVAEPPPAAPAPQPAPKLREFALPAELRVPVELATPFDHTAFIGIGVQALVTQDVLDKSAVVIPKGATLRGRLRRLEPEAGPPPYFIVAIEFTDVEFPGNHARFFGSLARIDTSVPGLGWMVNRSSSQTISRRDSTTRVDRSVTYRTTEIPGVGTFFLEGTSFRLHKGMQMTWVTKELRK